MNQTELVIEYEMGQPNRVNVVTCCGRFADMAAFDRFIRREAFANRIVYSHTVLKVMDNSDPNW